MNGRTLLPTLGIVLIALGGCAASTNTLQELASACTQANQVPVIVNGVVKVEDGRAVTKAKYGACADEWSAYNKASDLKEKRKKSKDADRNICPRGEVAYCEWHGCSCVDSTRVRNALRQLGF